MAHCCLLSAVSGVFCGGGFLGLDLSLAVVVKILQFKI